MGWIMALIVEISLISLCGGPWIRTGGRWALAGHKEGVIGCPRIRHPNPSPFPF